MKVSELYTFNERYLYNYKRTSSIVIINIYLIIYNLRRDYKVHTFIQLIRKYKCNLEMLCN